MDLLTSEQATVFVYEGAIPNVVGIADDTVYFGVDDDKGAPLVLVETGDESILAWAEETFESYRREASVLTLEEFAQLLGTAPEAERVEKLVDAEQLEQPTDAPRVLSNSPAGRHR